MWVFEFEAPYRDQCKKLGWAITTRNINNCWWSQKDLVWKNNTKGPSSTHVHCKTFKAFQRHLRKHPELQIEGAEVILVSRYKGYDIKAKWVTHDKGE